MAIYEYRCGQCKSEFEVILTLPPKTVTVAKRVLRVK